MVSLKSLCSIFPGLVLLSVMILNCSPARSDSDYSDYEGQFQVLSMNPPREGNLRRCDTIRTVFAYTLPPRISTIDSVYRFWMSLSVDTGANAGGPNRRIGTYLAEGRKRHDTLAIACPVRDFLFWAPNKPIEIKFAMLTTSECPEGIPDLGSCGDVIEYSQQYRYSKGVDTATCP
jgi:hypothetical protein